jgi:methionyl-tRNA formyltransferase
VLAASTLEDALPRLLSQELVAVPQDDTAAISAPKLAKAEAALDWRRAAADLDAQVRAFNPWPVAEARLDDGRRLRVLESAVLPGGASARPGAIVAVGRDGIDVATGSGTLRLARIQPPSGRVMPAAAYLAAHSLDGRSFVA